MRKSYRLFVVVALFALGVACWSGLGSTAQEKLKGVKDGTQKELNNEKELNKKLGFGAAPLPKWEYKMTKFHRDEDATEKELNKLGDDGWELVGTTAPVPGGGFVNSMGRLIFKRPKR